MPWILRLNDMRASNVEMLFPLCHAEDPEALVKLLADERVPDYKDGPWWKVFRKDGPLEWFNFFDNFQECITCVPETITLHHVVFRYQEVKLPTVEALLSQCPPYTRLERVANASGMP